jgi:hypothetical protein
MRANKDSARISEQQARLMQEQWLIHELKVADIVRLRPPAIGLHAVEGGRLGPLTRTEAVANAFDKIGIACDISWATRFVDELSSLGYLLQPVTTRDMTITHDDGDDCA